MDLLAVLSNGVIDAYVYNTWRRERGATLPRRVCEHTFIRSPAKNDFL